MLTGASTLKFIPEELVVYCRDFRVFHFRFHESGLEPQAFRVSFRGGGLEFRTEGDGVIYTAQGRPLESFWLGVQVFISLPGTEMKASQAPSAERVSKSFAGSGTSQQRDPDGGTRLFLI